MKPAYLIALAMGMCLSGCGGHTRQPVANSVVVNVKANGELTIDGKPSSLQALSRELTAAAAAFPGEKPTVRVFVNETVPFVDHMYVMNEVREAGLPVVLIDLR